MTEVRLCSTGDIEENAAKGFVVDGQSIFIVRRDNQYYAYLNQCPHTGVELNWQPDQFMDMEHFFIQCSVHGALFQVENGYCLRGPCANQTLTPFPISIADDQIYTELKEE